jgi:hypothetical protein
MNRRIRALLAVAGLFAVVSSSAQSASLALDPAKACMALADSGLRTRGGYNAVGGETFRCDSQRKTILAGDTAQDEIRFSALGNKQTVEEFLLVLNVRSRGDFQRAHRKLAEYATKLTKGMLQIPLPKDVNAAILSAINGSWTSEGYVFDLRRTTVANGLYELRLSIR